MNQIMFPHAHGQQRRSDAPQQNLATSRDTAGMTGGKSIQGPSPMPHYSPLISTIVVGLVLAFALGALAHRVRVSPLVGYLLAGIVIGPFTPGYIADQNVANELAGIGVIILMFGVGQHILLVGFVEVVTVQL